MAAAAQAMADLYKAINALPDSFKALKAASVVLLRLGRIEESRARLHVLAAVDSRDQLGASKLLEVIATFENPDESDLSLVAA